MSSLRDVVTTLVLLLYIFCSVVNCNEDAKRLYDDLMENSGYDPLIRPVSNASEVLPVKLGVKLAQIIDVVRACSFNSPPPSQPFYP